MDQGIHQGFAQGPVQGRIVLAKIALEHKRHLQISHQFTRYSAEKIKEIAGPGSIGDNPVQPAGLRGLVFRLLLVIDKIIGHSLLKSRPLSEHEQTCQGQPLFSGLPVLTKAAKNLEKLLVIQTKPGMVGTMGGQHITVGVQTLRIQILQAKTG